MDAVDAADAVDAVGSISPSKMEWVKARQPSTERLNSRPRLARHASSLPSKLTAMRGTAATRFGSCLLKTAVRSVEKEPSGKEGDCPKTSARTEE